MTLSDRAKLAGGLTAIAVGIVVALGAAFVVHAAEAPRFNEFGQEMFPAIPRAWQLVTLAQIVSLGGVFLAMGGLALAYVYDKPLTWARAAVGAALFVATTLILFGIVPNQFLTLAQATWEWTPTKTFVTIPRWLVLNNDLSISYAALKDMISGTYAVVALVAVGVAMVKWQNRQKEATAPKPTPVSEYGRPLKVEG